MMKGAGRKQGMAEEGEGAAHVEAEHPEEELGRVRAGERTFEGLGYKRLADNWPNEHFIDGHSAKRSLH